MPRIAARGATAEMIKQDGERVLRVRVRAIMAWRARWLAVYAMGFSKMMACRKAHVGIHALYPLLQKMFVSFPLHPLSLTELPIYWKFRIAAGWHEGIR